MTTTDADERRRNSPERITTLEVRKLKFTVVAGKGITENGQIG